MRRLAALLYALGLIAGGAVALALFVHLGIPGASWLVNVGLAKLAFLGAGGLVASGAVVERIAKRDAAREADRLHD